MSTTLQNARAGDLQAFQQLVRQHQAEVFGLALQLTGQQTDAAELAQDVCVALHTAIPRIANPAHLRHWLSRAVTQRALEQGWQQDPERESVVVAQDPGEDFTARVMAHVELRWSHRRADFAAQGTREHRGRGRALLIGAAAILGAAVITALWMTGMLQKPAATAASSPAAVAAGDTPPVAAPTKPDAVAAPASRSSRSVPLPDAFPQYSVIVLPLRHVSRDADAAGAAEAFHAALVAELRKDPALVLLVPGVTAPPDTQRPADYVLTVTSLETRPLSSGGTAFRITDSRGGSLSAGSPASGRQWPIVISILPLAQTTSTGFASTLQIGGDAAALLQLATKQAEMLRARMFPDTQLKQRLMARFRDASLPAAERNLALDELLGPQHARGSGLTAVDISIIVAGAAAMPADQRAQLWRSLRDTANPDLVATLVDSLRRDPEPGVRFEALATLAADYGNAPGVRAAIESTSKEDSEQIMRAAARRVLSGETEWRSYVQRSLKDTRLPLPERLAPLLIAARSASTPAETLALRNLVNDEETANLLLGVIHDSWFDYTQSEAIGDAVTLLASSGNPASQELLVEIPLDTPRSGPVLAAAPPPQAAPAPQIPPAVMSWLQNNRNNPFARQTLNDIARGNINPQQIALIERMAQMQQRPPPRRP